MITPMFGDMGSVQQQEVDRFAVVPPLATHAPALAFWAVAAHPNPVPATTRCTKKAQQIIAVFVSREAGCR